MSLLTGLFGLDDATSAHAFALTKSTQIRDEVTVHDITKEPRP